jgi:hypothetical protein
VQLLVTSSSSQVVFWSGSEIQGDSLPYSQVHGQSLTGSDGAVATSTLNGSQAAIFHYFAKLPKEIRAMIWEEVCRQDRHFYKIYFVSCNMSILPLSPRYNPFSTSALNLDVLRSEQSLRDVAHQKQDGQV